VGAAPRRIVASPANEIYIATRDGVKVFDADGNLHRELNTTSPARSVAVADDGTVYIGVRTHVEVYDSDGQPVAKWEPPARRPWITGLCLCGDEVFAADSGSRVVFRYDRAGKVLGKVGEKNPERNYRGLIVPSPYLDVKAGRDGLLRVNNPGFHRVEIFTREGELEQSWGKASASIDGFCGCCNPIGLTLLPDGRVITCEKGLPRVKVYTAEGTLDGVVAGPESFRANAKPGQLSDLADGTLGGLDAAVDSKGSVYVLDLVASEVHVMRPKS
jgi:sugar lactone lactonase YvrE